MTETQTLPVEFRPWNDIPADQRRINPEGEPEALANEWLPWSGPTEEVRIPVGETWEFTGPIAVTFLDLHRGGEFGSASQATPGSPFYLTGTARFALRIPVGSAHTVRPA